MQPCYTFTKLTSFKYKDGNKSHEEIKKVSLNTGWRPYWFILNLKNSLNGKWTCIHIALFQATDHSKRFTTLAAFTHSHTHLYTDGRGCYARCQLHIRSNLGFSILQLMQLSSARGSWDSNQRPSDQYTTHSTPWATVAPPKNLVTTTARQEMVSFLWDYFQMWINPHLVL